MARTTGEALERLVAIMARLRAEGGCPWDREQDLRSLRPYLIEEAYEVLDEMDRVAEGGPWGPLREELGDLLFQIVFHAQLATELGEFQMRDVCEAISDKIESRHPHVFGDRPVSGTEEVLANWAQLKAEERRKKTGREGSVLDGVPRQAPALLRAERLTEKASRIGFDWPDRAGVWGKLEEELGELKAAMEAQDRLAQEHELGDVLFSLANVGRFLRIPPEDALRGTLLRFISRFHQIEHGLREQGIPFGKATLAQMDALWDQAKRKEKQVGPPGSQARSDLAELVVGVPSPAQVQRFWDARAPALGWRRLPGPPGDSVYHLGSLQLRFTSGPGAPGAGLSLLLAAPSRAAVDDFARQFAPGQTPQPDDQGRYTLAFTDPSGLLCRYAFPAAPVGSP